MAHDIQVGAGYKQSLIASGTDRKCRHWKANAVLGYDTHQDVLDRLHYTARFHRAHLQKVLLVAVPKSILHLKKRNVGLEPDHNSVTINFEDGSSVTQDLVVVSDGIHSVGFLMT